MAEQLLGPAAEVLHAMHDGRAVLCCAVQDEEEFKELAAEAAEEFRPARKAVLFKLPKVRGGCMRVGSGGAGVLRGGLPIKELPCRPAVATHGASFGGLIESAEELISWRLLTQVVGLRTCFLQDEEAAVEAVFRATVPRDHPMYPTIRAKLDVVQANAQVGRDGGRGRQALPVCEGARWGFWSCKGGGAGRCRPWVPGLSHARVVGDPALQAPSLC